jgi:hypothetical protein
VPSVKKSTYFEPTTCASFSAGLLFTEEAPCEGFCPCAWLTDEVAEALAVDVAPSVRGAAAVEVAVVEAAGASAPVLDADEVGVELAVVGMSAVSALVDAAVVDVAARAATKLVLKAQTVRLVRRTQAAGNAITLFFIPS